MDLNSSYLSSDYRHPTNCAKKMSAVTAPLPSAMVTNFSNLRSSDAQNIRLHRLYVRRQFAQCRQIVEDILKSTPEALCESQLILMAKITRETANLRESLSWLERARVHNPNSARLLFEIGKNHYLLAEHQQAIQIFLSALRRDPDDWKIYYWLSLTYYNSDRPPVSIKKAQEVLFACPAMNCSVDILTFLGRLLDEQSENLEPAVEAYRRSIQLEPENVGLFHTLGMLFLKMRNEEDGFATLAQALTHDASYVPSVLAVASILQSRGDFDVALSKYRVLAAEFDHSCALWNNIGMCYYGRGKLITAIACLNKANYLCPLDWKTLYNLAICYYAMRQFASAYHFIAAAFAICSQNPLILMMIAMTLTELGDFRNARAAYRRALRLGPDQFVIRLNFGLFEFRHGDTSAAVRRVGAALRDFGAGHNALKAVASSLAECFQRLAHEDADLAALLRRIYADRVDAELLDAEADAIAATAAVAVGAAPTSDDQAKTNK